MVLKFDENNKPKDPKSSIKLKHKKQEENYTNNNQIV